MKARLLLSPAMRRLEFFDWLDSASEMVVDSRNGSKWLMPVTLVTVSSSLALMLNLWAGQYFEKAPFILYFLVVFIGAWIGGWRIGLFAVSLTILFAVHFSPILQAQDIAPAITYIGTCCLTVFLLARAQHAAVERHQAELALQKLNRELEARVAQRTAAWEQANQDLEAFAYSISHDLRTPLRAIEGFSRIIQEDYATRLDPKAAQFFENIRGNAGRMNQMIQDLLTFSRLSRKPMTKARVDMQTLAQAVADELLALEPARQIRLTVQGLPDACGDLALLRQVLTNLFSNAIKFTRQTQEAIIEVGATEEDGATIFCVRDNGVGFDQNYAHKLFKVFQRLHKPEEFEGTGVGLSIVHRIIQRHGGRVWAEGKRNVGARFSFSLPHEPWEEPASTPPVPLSEITPLREQKPLAATSHAETQLPSPSCNALS